jgi:CheY-like chemotaxis protein
MKNKILVVDDEELLTRTFVSLLEKKGYEVMVATKGQDAIEMVKEDDFDLVICDIRMPGISGAETVKQIKEIAASRKKEPKIIFISGFADATGEKEARDLHPEAYIEKPFDVGNLLAEIKRAIS